MLSQVRTKPSISSLIIGILFLTGTLEAGRLKNFLIGEDQVEFLKYSQIIGINASTEEGIVILCNEVAKYTAVQKKRQLEQGEEVLFKLIQEKIAKSINKCDDTIKQVKRKKNDDEDLMERTELESLYLKLVSRTPRSIEYKEIAKKLQEELKKYTRLKMKRDLTGKESNTLDYLKSITPKEVRNIDNIELIGHKLIFLPCLPQMLQGGIQGLTRTDSTDPTKVRANLPCNEFAGRSATITEIEQSPIRDFIKAFEMDDTHEQIRADPSFLPGLDYDTKSGLAVDNILPIASNAVEFFNVVQKRKSLVQSEIAKFQNMVGKSFWSTRKIDVYDTETGLNVRLVRFEKVKFIRYKWSGRTTTFLFYFKLGNNKTVFWMGDPDKFEEIWTTVDFRKKYSDWDTATWEAIQNRQFFIGMTDEQVRMSLGEPGDINRTVGSWGVHEQWVYGSPVYGAKYLYFENGKLVAYQD